MLNEKISETNQLRAVQFLNRIGDMSSDNQTYIFGVLTGMMMSAGLPDKPNSPAPKKRGRKPKSEGAEHETN